MVSIVGNETTIPVLERGIYTPINHPFDYLPARELVAQTPYAELVATIQRPYFSAFPTDLESWEDEQVAKTMQLITSKNGQTIETPTGYLLRALYFELFGAKSSGTTFQASEGITTGGLISHHYTRSDGLSELLKLPIEGNTLVDALGNFPVIPGTSRYRHPASSFLGVIADMTFPRYMERMNRPTGRNLDEHLESRASLSPAILEEMSTYGYRLFRLLKTIPELQASIEDERLKALVNILPDLPLTRAQFIHDIWSRNLGNPHAEKGNDIFDSQQRFRQQDDPRALKGIDTLVMLRTHPELQFLFRHRSPSGFLTNERVSDN